MRNALLVVEQKKVITISAPRNLLSGVRVLDVGHLVAGPMTASVLGDFGADVIKIERPGTGDPLRWNHEHDGVGLFYKVQARNKRCITLDLKSGRGREIFHDLVRTSDVVVENFRPGVMERLGGGWDTLRNLNPKLVYCRISGWGQDGPYSARSSFGRIAEAFSGFAYLTGEYDGPPMHSTMSLGDSVAAMWAANAVLMALYWRDAQGGDVGQVIDLGLYEPLYRQIEQQILVADLEPEPLRRFGNEHSGCPVMGCYPTNDGRYFSFSANTARSIAATIRAIGLDGDPRFVDFGSCLANRRQLHDHIRSLFASMTAAEIDALFVAASAPGGVVMSAADLIEDPQVLARGMVVTVDDEELGKIKMQGVVPRFSETPGEIRHAGQRMGQSNFEVLTELGLGAREIADLENNGVI